MAPHHKLSRLPTECIRELTLDRGAEIIVAAGWIAAPESTGARQLVVVVGFGTVEPTDAKAVPDDSADFILSAVVLISAVRDLFGTIAPLTHLSSGPWAFDTTAVSAGLAFSALGVVYALNALL